MSYFSCFGENSTRILSLSRRRRSGNEAPGAGQTPGAENQPPVEIPGDGDENRPADETPGGDDAADEHIPRTIALSQIKKATKNFRRDCIVGEGGYASVYKGRFERQNIAVKRLMPATFRDYDYHNEVRLLSPLNHPNIINFIGCCLDEYEEERIIIYEFMPLGTLYDHLQGRRTGQPALNWDTRMRIATGVATGLIYLHTLPDHPIIYRDLKPTNVLLGDGFHPKISDFRVARFASAVDRSLSVTSPVYMGTYPYWAPENVVQGRYSSKSDVYSFGALLLEMILGDVPMDTDSRGAVADSVRLDNNLINLVDPKMDQLREDMLMKAVSLALVCMNVTPDLRPEMIDVLRAMKHLTPDPNAEWPEEIMVAVESLPTRRRVESLPTRRRVESLPTRRRRGRSF